MARIAAFVVLFLSVWIAPPAGAQSECTTDRECPGARCVKLVDRACQLSAGFMCRFFNRCSGCERRICVPDRCQSDADCGSTRCLGGICEDSPCVTGSADCGAQLVCSRPPREEARLCLERPFPGCLGSCKEPGCRSDADCIGDFICQQSTSGVPACRPPLCTRGRPCPKRQICHQGRCAVPVLGCNDDADCPFLYQCEEGVCTEPSLFVPPDACDVLVCPPGSTCVHGGCFQEVPPICMEMRCPEGTVCVNGRCAGWGGRGPTPGGRPPLAPNAPPP